MVEGEGSVRTAEGEAAAIRLVAWNPPSAPNRLGRAHLGRDDDEIAPVNRCGLRVRWRPPPRPSRLTAGVRSRLVVTARGHAGAHAAHNPAFLVAVHWLQPITLTPANASGSQGRRTQRKHPGRCEIPQIRVDLLQMSHIARASSAPPPRTPVADEEGRTRREACPATCARVISPDTRPARGRRP
ncbi:hypothetical protein CALVIDRAFT_352940 [Calocera viscosa TUFC12733]|uniref:Uncharacterized protein n=1 Tax=Calocera viscosa (strain TUFC12733) TaxID=1330018 RepID=A0A167QBN2_CALVF|nr:hypothetical protein CALVIDRAFT_352940 [Calocera viscosa TUFC12733]